MRVLLIKPKHIGDTLILTPTITAHQGRPTPKRKYGSSCARGCEGILAGCPAIHPSPLPCRRWKKASERRPADFLACKSASMLRLLRVRFDYIIELGDGHRGRLLRACSVHAKSALLGQTGQPRLFRRLNKSGASPPSPAFDWKTCHRVEKDFLFRRRNSFPCPNPSRPFASKKNSRKPWPAGRKRSPTSAS